MRSECVNIYKYDELPTESAKKRARDWYREGAFDYDWWDVTYEDFIQVAEALGFEIDYKTRTTAKGKEYKEPQVFFRGFWNQGDGASFMATFRLDKGANAGSQIRAYAGCDEKLHAIGDSLEAEVQLLFETFPALKGNGSIVTIGQSDNHYSHKYTMSASDEIKTDLENITDTSDFDWRVVGEKLNEFRDSVLEDARNLAQWLYDTLEKECEYLNSDESVVESIEANGYEFYEDGTRSRF